MTVNPLTYNTLLASVENIIIDTGSADLLAIFPQALQYAEGRLYRDLDLLATRTSDTSVTLVAGTRTATCPSTISIVEGVSVLTPIGQPVSSSKRNVLERTSLDFLDFAYGQESVTAKPDYFTMKSDTLIVFGASPDAAYRIEVTGTTQPDAMSVSNQTSFLGNQFPDLLLSAVIIFISGWQRDMGSPMNPQDVNMWASSYDSLFKSALEYVQRQKAQDPNYSPFSPTSLSTPRP